MIKFIIYHRIPRFIFSYIFDNTDCQFECSDDFCFILFCHVITTYKIGQYSIILCYYCILRILNCVKQI